MNILTMNSHPHWEWGCASQGMGECLKGNAYPHWEWGCASTGMHIAYTGWSQLWCLMYPQNWWKVESEWKQFSRYSKSLIRKLNHQHLADKILSVRIGLAFFFNPISPGGGGGGFCPTRRLSLIIPKRHKISKWNFSSLILHFWRSFCTWWQFSLIVGVAMATFCFDCVVGQKSEETCIFARVLAWSYSNFAVRGYFGF